MDRQLLAFFTSTNSKKKKLLLDVMKEGLAVQDLLITFFLLVNTFNFCINTSISFHLASKKVVHPFP